MLHIDALENNLETAGLDSQLSPSTFSILLLNTVNYRGKLSLFVHFNKIKINGHVTAIVKIPKISLALREKKDIFLR